mgnify:CR=1 FL=1|tara:strand:+ start:9457 stop:10881 length:1425 start_codon:yes stop_codon:yes gene_type:complete
MASVTIQIQPRNIISTLEPCFFQFSQSAVDTLNVVAQLQYDTTGSGNWVNWGGRMRSAPVLNVAGVFQLEAQDIWNSLPKGFANDIKMLGSGCCYGGGLGSSLPQMQWSQICNWQVRLIVQREFLDASTGFIELDPQTTISNTFVVYEASPPRRNSLWGTSYIPDSDTLGEYVMQGNASEARDGFLWLTDAITQRKARTPMITCHIKPTEQFYLHTINGRLLSGVSNPNRLVIETFNAQDMMLNGRVISWLNGSSNNYMQSIDVGFRSIKCALSEGGAESADFANVAYYHVYNSVSNGSSGLSKSVVWKFIVDRSCNTKAYQRFLWKNQLGGWDMFTIDGKLTSRRKFKHSKYEKRIGRDTSVYSYGENNWLNTEETIFKVDSQKMTTDQAMWISKIAASSFTYLRVDMQSDYNPQTWQDFSALETWRDAGRCNKFIPIIIDSTSIRYQDTNKRNIQKVSFEYKLALSNIYPRN